MLKYFSWLYYYFDYICVSNLSPFVYRMDILEGSIAVHGRGKNKRKWIPVEDDELIKALVHVSLGPRWRSDGSFKNGYTSVLEARLAEKLPDSRISATPHIDSRLRYFKTKYSALEQMLNKSGFTWDPTKKMIQCEKQQYETHCKVCSIYNLLLRLQSAAPFTIFCSVYSTVQSALFTI
jgi:hypothetical protein